MEEKFISFRFAEELIEFLPDQLTEVQKECAEAVLGGDENFVLTAPTGSGKTWVTGFAVIRLLYYFPKTKIIYICPTKALCVQQAKWFNDKLQPLATHLNQKSKKSAQQLAFVCTGDTYTKNFLGMMEQVSILVCTPEKLDSLTRTAVSSSNLQQILRSIGLLIIDEVHLLSEEKRGPILECLVSKLKYFNPKNMRIGAVSATAPNIRTIARWLNVSSEDCILEFGDEFRPLPLNVRVKGFPMRGSNEYMFESFLDYKIPDIIYDYGQRNASNEETFGNNLINFQTLVFCSSRKSSMELAEKLAKQKLFHPSKHLIEQSSLVQDQTLRKVIQHGVAFHNASLSYKDRILIEDLYKSHLIFVVCSTTTLALGMNLPADLVIIKSTRVYRGLELGIQDIDNTSLLQMIGRAGRLGFSSRRIPLL
eukprot:snap_masked-scaffold_8-processed-gene-1.29-mRNA-1 protein AED:1.00 eAED:1.00 QI:0/0/0/0/1/1/2/0/421